MRPKIFVPDIDFLDNLPMYVAKKKYLAEAIELSKRYLRGEEVDNDFFKTLRATIKVGEIKV